MVRLHLLILSCFNSYFIFHYHVRIIVFFYFKIHIPIFILSQLSHQLSEFCIDKLHFFIILFISWWWFLEKIKCFSLHDKNNHFSVFRLAITTGLLCWKSRSLIIQLHFKLLEHINRFIQCWRNRGMYVRVGICVCIRLRKFTWCVESFARMYGTFAKDDKSSETQYSEHLQIRAGHCF